MGYISQNSYLYIKKEKKSLGAVAGVVDYYS